MAAPRHQQGLQIFKLGLPLIALTVGGWLALSAFVGGRLDVEDARRQVPDERAPAHKQRAKRFSVHEELARLRPDDDYENKPVPRPPDGAPHS